MAPGKKSKPIDLSLHPEIVRLLHCLPEGKARTLSEQANLAGPYVSLLRRGRIRSPGFEALDRLANLVGMEFRLFPKTGKSK